jgi:hypothetical protein
VTSKERLTRYAPILNGSAFMGMARESKTFPGMFGPEYDYTHGPYVLASEADAEIERLHERYAELNAYADHTNHCHVNASGDHATCDCGYLALMVTDRKQQDETKP